MVKNKKLLIIAAITVVLVIGGGVTAALHHGGKKQSELSLLSGSAQDPYSTGTESSQAAPATSGAAGAAAQAANLNVAKNSTATQLGQITGSQASQQGVASANGSAASEGAANSVFDPSTFAQYDKYKTGNGAAFGDVVKGTGDELSDGKKAAVYYRGWLTNGTKFDESRPGSDGKLQPFVFQLGAHQVIPGWEQALAGMKVGGVRLVVVPPSVGYGASGQGSIPPNSVLVFQVQLAAVQ